MEHDSLTQLFVRTAANATIPSVAIKIYIKKIIPNAAMKRAIGEITKRMCIISESERYMKYKIEKNTVQETLIIHSMRGRYAQICILRFIGMKLRFT